MLLLFLIFANLVESIDFRSNHYRQLPLDIPNNYVNSQPNTVNPYLNIFDTPNFPRATLTTGIARPTTTTTTTTTTVAQTSPTTRGTTRTRPTTTPTLWTTSKSPLKLSKNPKKSAISANSFDSAQLSVLSHRLLNDVLIVPSSRRLYILAIIPIHQASSQQNFECGEIDLNAVVRLAAFLDSLKSMNEANLLKEIGAEIGAIVVDSCSTDLRTVADLYELLSGTNIQRNDIIAVVRDDGTHMPNAEHVFEQLNLPVLNTFITVGHQAKTSGTLPHASMAFDAIFEALRNYHTSCVNLIFDEKFERTIGEFHELAMKHSICVETQIFMKNASSHVAEETIRTLLLSEARIVVALLGESTWLSVGKSLRTEMVIAGRFVFVALQDARWSTAQKFVETWPTFEQNLIALAPKVSINHDDELRKLADTIPRMKLPTVWLKQFWASAFKCHVGDDDVGDDDDDKHHKFSRQCASSQKFNISQVTPNVDVASISIAAHTIGVAFRSFVDRVCPGALVISISDCVNDPSDGFYHSILDQDFVHHLSDYPITFNVSSGYRDAQLVINRVQFDDDRLELSEIGVWHPTMGYADSGDGRNATSRGSYLLMSSTCSRSKCAQEMAKSAIRREVPSIFKALTDIEILLFTIFSVLSCLTCLMCMYLKVISTSDYRNCTAVGFLGLAFLSLSAPAFIIPPNEVSCILRRTLFPIAMCTASASVFVKALLLWRFKDADVRTSSALFIMSSIVAIQTVISFEWLLLSPAPYTEFVSSIHGTMWRCAPGNTAENSILTSCGLVGIMSILTFVFSISALRHPQSIQNLLISIVTIMFEIGLYVSLPLLTYKSRDLVMATSVLIFAFLALLASHLSRAADDEKAGNAAADTLKKHWITQVQNYHTASTHPQSIQLEDKSTLPRQTNAALYGVEAYGTRL
ncbi:unnamed protein product [Caenorhabditis bovis]|uniref:G-protein coupled receptors family 3 profile domain-containing protein n=1 Tax=Caenorhabditis bovis TaxID=2654633 RepID=A0A8S1ENW9_9PELO|nr:unnamed protein product [Caenorhabditis bovis]